MGVGIVTTPQDQEPRPISVTGRKGRYDRVPDRGLPEPDPEWTKRPQAAKAVARQPAGLPPASSRQVGTAYGFGVVLPVLATPALAGLVVWLVERVSGPGTADGEVAVVLFVGYLLAGVGTLYLAAGFREDRRQGIRNGATGWLVASVVLMVLPLVLGGLLLLFGLGLAIGTSNMRM